MSDPKLRRRALAAARARRRYERQARGIVVAPVECDQIALSEKLRDAGFLPAHAPDDPQTLGRALAKVVAAWVDPDA